jgi:hypothetical protein
LPPPSALEWRTDFSFHQSVFQTEYLTDQLRAGSNGFVDKTAGPEEIRNEVMRAVALFETEKRVLGSGRFEKSKAQRELEAEGAQLERELIRDGIKNSITQTAEGLAWPASTA